MAFTIKKCINLAKGIQKKAYAEINRQKNISKAYEVLMEAREFSNFMKQIWHDPKQEQKTGATKADLLKERANLDEAIQKLAQYIESMK